MASQNREHEYLVASDESEEVESTVAESDDTGLCPEASGSLTVSKKVLLAVAAVEGLCIAHVAASLQADLEVVLVAVANNGLALQYAAAPLRADREVVLIAVANTGFALQYVAAPLKADKEVVLAAVANNGLALQFAAAPLKADREVVLTAVAQSDKKRITEGSIVLERQARHFIEKNILESASAPLRWMIEEGARRCKCTCQLFAISELKEPTACVNARLHLKTCALTPVVIERKLGINAGEKSLADVIREYGKEVELQEPLLQGVDLSYNPAMSCEILGKSLESLLGFKIQALNLSLNPQLTDNIVAAIHPLLQTKKSCLTDLKLAGCGMTATGMKWLVKLAVKSSLRLLDLSCMKISDESALLEQVLELPMIEHLSLRSCDLGPEEASTIAEHLPFTGVRSLHLAGNAFGSEGVVYLASKLSESMVEELDLSGVGIEAKCEGLCQLAKAWVDRPFAKLCLKGNPMGQTEIANFIATLRTLRPSSSADTICDEIWTLNDDAGCC